MTTNKDRYNAYLLTNYMTKTKDWQGFTEEDIETIKQDIGMAIENLHGHGFQHGDVNDGTVLVEKVYWLKILLSTLTLVLLTHFM